MDNDNPEKGTASSPEPVIQISLDYEVIEFRPLVIEGTALEIDSEFMFKGRFFEFPPQSSVDDQRLKNYAQATGPSSSLLRSGLITSFRSSYSIQPAQGPSTLYFKVIKRPKGGLGRIFSNPSESDVASAAVPLEDLWHLSSNNPGISLHRVPLMSKPLNALEEGRPNGFMLLSIALLGISHRESPMITSSKVIHSPSRPLSLGPAQHQSNAGPPWPTLHLQLEAMTNLKWPDCIPFFDCDQIALRTRVGEIMASTNSIKIPDATIPMTLTDFPIHARLVVSCRTSLTDKPWLTGKRFPIQLLASDSMDAKAPARVLSGILFRIPSPDEGIKTLKLHYYTSMNTSNLTTARNVLDRLKMESHSVEDDTNTMSITDAVQSTIGRMGEMWRGFVDPEAGQNYDAQGSTTVDLPPVTSASLSEEFVQMDEGIIYNRRMNAPEKRERLIEKGRKTIQSLLSHDQNRLSEAFHLGGFDVYLTTLNGKVRTTDDKPYNPHFTYEPQPNEEIQRSVRSQQHTAHIIIRPMLLHHLEPLSLLLLSSSEVDRIPSGWIDSTLNSGYPDCLQNPIFMLEASIGARVLFRRFTDGPSDRLHRISLTKDSRQGCSILFGPLESSQFTVDLDSTGWARAPPLVMRIFLVPASMLIIPLESSKDKREMMSYQTQQEALEKSHKACLAASRHCVASASIPLDSLARSLSLTGKRPTPKLTLRKLKIYPAAIPDNENSPLIPELFMECAAYPSALKSQLEPVHQLPWRFPRMKEAIVMIKIVTPTHTQLSSTLNNGPFYLKLFSPHLTDIQPLYGDDDTNGLIREAIGNGADSHTVVYRARKMIVLHPDRDEMINSRLIGHLRISISNHSNFEVATYSSPLVVGSDRLEEDITFDRHGWPMLSLTSFQFVNRLVSTRRSEPLIGDIGIGLTVKDTPSPSRLPSAIALDVEQCLQCYLRLHSVKLFPWSLLVIKNFNEVVNWTQTQNLSIQLRAGSRDLVSLPLNSVPHAFNTGDGSLSLTLPGTLVSLPLDHRRPLIITINHQHGILCRAIFHRGMIGLNFRDLISGVDPTSYDSSVYAISPSHPFQESLSLWERALSFGRSFTSPVSLEMNRENTIATNIQNGTFIENGPLCYNAPLSGRIPHPNEIKNYTPASISKSHAISANPIIVPLIRDDRHCIGTVKIAVFNDEPEASEEDDSNLTEITFVVDLLDFIQTSETSRHRIETFQDDAIDWTTDAPTLTSSTDKYFAWEWRLYSDSVGTRGCPQRDEAQREDDIGYADGLWNEADHVLVESPSDKVAMYHTILIPDVNNSGFLAVQLRLVVRQKSTVAPLRLVEMHTMSINLASIIASPAVWGRIETYPTYLSHGDICKTNWNTHPISHAIPVPPQTTPSGTLTLRIRPYNQPIGPRMTSILHPKQKWLHPFQLRLVFWTMDIEKNTLHRIASDPRGRSVYLDLVFSQANHACKQLSNVPLGNIDTKSTPHREGVSPLRIHHRCVINSNDLFSPAQTRRLLPITYALPDANREDVHDTQWPCDLDWKTTLSKSSLAINLNVDSYFSDSQDIDTADLGRVLLPRIIKWNETANLRFQSGRYPPHLHSHFSLPFRGRSGRLQVELCLLSMTEALAKPCGSGRKSPNRHPYLPEPGAQPSMIALPILWAKHLGADIADAVESSAHWLSGQLPSPFVGELARWQGRIVFALKVIGCLILISVPLWILVRIKDILVLLFGIVLAFVKGFGLRTSIDADTMGYIFTGLLIIYLLWRSTFLTSRIYKMSQWILNTLMEDRSIDR